MIEIDSDTEARRQTALNNQWGYREGFNSSGSSNSILAIGFETKNKPACIAKNANEKRGSQQTNNLQRPCKGVLNSSCHYPGASGREKMRMLDCGTSQISFKLSDKCAEISESEVENDD